MKRQLLKEHLMPMMRDDKSCTHELGLRHCQENREHWAKVNDEEVKECNKCHDTAHLLSQNMIDEIEKEASE